MEDFNSIPNPTLDKFYNNSPSQKNSIYNYFTFYTNAFRHLHLIQSNSPILVLSNKIESIKFGYRIYSDREKDPDFFDD